MQWSLRSDERCCKTTAEKVPGKLSEESGLDRVQDPPMFASLGRRMVPRSDHRRVDVAHHGPRGAQREIRVGSELLDGSALVTQKGEGDPTWLFRKERTGVSGSAAEHTSRKNGSLMVSLTRGGASVPMRMLLAHRVVRCASPPCLRETTSGARHEQRF